MKRIVLAEGMFDNTRGFYDFIHHDLIDGMIHDENIRTLNMIKRYRLILEEVEEKKK